MHEKLAPRSSVMPNLFVMKVGRCTQTGRERLHTFQFAVHTPVIIFIQWHVLLEPGWMVSFHGKGWDSSFSEATY